MALRGKLIVPFVVVFCSTIIVLSVVSIRIQKKSLLKSLDEKTESLTRNLGGLVGDHVAMGEDDATQLAVLSTKVSDADVTYVTVVGLDGRILASTNVEQRGHSLPQRDLAALTGQTEFSLRPSSDGSDVVMPVTYNGRVQGFLLLGVSTARVEAAIRKNGAITLVLASIALLLGAAVYTWIARIVTLPLLDVARQLGNLAGGRADLNLRLPVQSSDEIGQLSESFNAFMDTMRTLVQSIQHTSHEVLQSANSLAEVTQQSSANLNQSTEVMSSIARDTQEVSHNTQRVAGSLVSMGRQAQEGSALTSQLVEKIQRVQMAASSALAVIEGLEKLSSEIEGIVGLIGKVADKTNLLALNAGIEAARVGEAGGGFGVVADEVKKLAEHSKASSHRIANISKEVRRQTEIAINNAKDVKGEATEGYALTAEASTRLLSILTQVGTIGQEMTSTATATENMAASTEEASAASEQQAASIDEVAFRAKRLNDVVSQLNSLVERFRL